MDYGPLLVAFCNALLLYVKNDYSFRIIRASEISNGKMPIIFNILHLIYLRNLERLAHLKIIHGSSYLFIKIQYKVWLSRRTVQFGIMIIKSEFIFALKYF